jgi:hypothetical protein
MDFMHSNGQDRGEIAGYSFPATERLNLTGGLVSKCSMRKGITAKGLGPSMGLRTGLLPYFAFE